MRNFHVVVLIASLGFADATFDCRRPNQACLNGGSCTFLSADCSCDADYSGYDCGLILADVDQNSCTPTTCLNGGTCYDDATGAKCYCDSEHYGNTCEKNRFSLTCVADLMVIGVNPYSAAGYEAFVEDKQGVTVCESQAVPSPIDMFDKIPDSWEGDYIQVEHDSADCGPSVPVITTGRKEFDRVVVVKYSPNVLTDIDDRYHVKCILEDNVVVESRVVKINVTGVISQHVVSRQDIAKAVDFYLLVGAGGLYNGEPLDVGTELRFVFGIQGVYTSMRVEEGEANNTIANDTKTLKLIEGSCVHADGYPVIAEPVTPDPSNSREFNLRIRAFHFDGNDEVIFSFRVRVCVAADNSVCDPATCTAPDGGYGRRKRDAGNEVQLFKTVKIRSGGGTQSDDNASPQPNTIPGVTPTGCETSWEITATLIAMAVALFFLLVLAVTLIIIVIMFRHNRRKREAKIDVYVDPFSVEKPR